MLPQAESEGSGCLYLHKHWLYFIFLLSFHFSFLVLNNFLVYNLCGINCILLKCKTQWVWKLHTRACAHTHTYTHTHTHTHTRETATTIRKQSTVTTPVPLWPSAVQPSLYPFLLSTLSLQTGLYLLEFYIEIHAIHTLLSDFTQHNDFEMYICCCIHGFVCMFLFISD